MEERIKIKKGSQGLCYIINRNGKEITFDGHYPICWALRELKVKDRITGALNCKKCEMTGRLNGVIISYCINCIFALQSIGESCGCLCIHNIKKRYIINDVINDVINCESNECCFKTYLKGVKIWEIGDRDLFEECGSCLREEFVGSEEDIKEEELNNRIYEDIVAESRESMSLLDSLSESSICGDDDEDVYGDIPDLIECGIMMRM